MPGLFQDLRKPLKQIIKLPERPKDTITLDADTWKQSGASGGEMPTGQALFSGGAFNQGIVESFVPTKEIRDFVEQVFNTILSGKGQGWWLQAEFGSGKSHLLSFLTIMVTSIDDGPWQILATTEKERERRGKFESLGRPAFQVLKDKLIFPITRSLVGKGGVKVGTDQEGRPLLDYILESAQKTFQDFTGKPLHAFPDEILADHFIKNHRRGQETDLEDWLGSKVAAGEKAPADYEALCELHDDSPRDAGALLWRFAEETGSLRTDNVPIDPGQVLDHLVDTILAEGFDGILVVLDEVSEFLNKSSNISRDEDCLIYLSEILTRAGKKPVWTICAAQQKIEQEKGMSRIIAEERLKEQHLLTDPLSFHDIVLKRTRQVIDPEACEEHYKYYHGRFAWVDDLPQDRLARSFQTRYYATDNLSDEQLGRKFFQYLFPIHPDAIEQVKAVSFRLTTTRAGIVVLYDALRAQVDAQEPYNREMVTPDCVFDQFESLRDGENTFKARFPREYEAFDKARAALAQSQRLGPAGYPHQQPLRALKTLFMAYLEMTPRHLTPRQVCDTIMMTRNAGAAKDENENFIQLMLQRMKRPTIPQVHGTDDSSEFWFDCVGDLPLPSELHQQIVGELTHSVQQIGGDHFKVAEVAKAWDRWMLFGSAQEQRTTAEQGAHFDSNLAWMQRSVNHTATDFGGIITKRYSDKRSILWKGREIQGRVELRDLHQPDTLLIQRIDTGASTGNDADIDFAVIIGRKPNGDAVTPLVRDPKADPRVLFWTPAALDAAQQQELIRWAALLRLVDRYREKQGEEAELVLKWVVQQLPEYLPKMMSVLVGTYNAGTIRSATVDQHTFNYAAAGQLGAVLERVVGDALDNVYESACLSLPVRGQWPNCQGLGAEDAVKVINGLVRQGRIPTGKQDQNTSAAERYAASLQLTLKQDPLAMDLSQCRFAQALRQHVAQTVQGTASLKVTNLYLNFMGVEPQSLKGAGLTRRLVQIYLLALVQQGELKITLNASTLEGTQEIDHSNIAATNFTAAVLSAIESVSRVEAPAEWEAVRPFAGVVLGHDLAPKPDEKQIRADWEAFEKAWADWAAQASRIQGELTKFFLDIGQQNLHATLMERFTGLLGKALTGTNDQKMRTLAWELQDRFGYPLNDAGKIQAPQQADVEDFRKKWATYTAICGFVDNTKDDVVVGFEYAGVGLPEAAQANLARESLAALGKVLERLPDLILQPALVQGDFQPAFKKAKDHYFDLYQSYHGALYGHSRKIARSIGCLREGDKAKALAALDAVRSLGQPAASKFQSDAAKAIQGLPSCDVEDAATLRQHLASRVDCKCLLALTEAPGKAQDIDDALALVESALDGALLAKATVLCSEPVRELLAVAAGKASDDRLTRLLNAGDPEAVALLLVKELGLEPHGAGASGTGEAEPAGAQKPRPDRVVAGERASLIDLLKWALGDLVVVEVDWAELRPTPPAIERSQVDEVIAEIRAALEQRFAEAASAGEQVVVQWKA